MQTISPATVIKIEEYTVDIRLYTLQLDLVRFYEPGSYFQLALDEVGSSELWPESRAFSFVSTFEGSGVVQVLIRRIGRFTQRLFEVLQLQKRCTIKYSFGEMLLPETSEGNIICLSGGVGVAPFLAFASQSVKDGFVSRLRLFCGVRTVAELQLFQSLKQQLPEENLTLYCEQEQVGDSIVGLLDIEEVIQQFDTDQDHFYLSGSPCFNSHALKFLERYNVKNKFFDHWS